MGLTNYIPPVIDGRAVVNNQINSTMNQGKQAGIIYPGGLAQSTNPVNAGAVNSLMLNKGYPVGQHAAGYMNSRSTVIIPQEDHPVNTPAELMAANIYPFPPAISVNVSSEAGAGGGSIRVYLFNRDYMNSVTNNGGGAGTVLYTYSDGFGGRVIDNLIVQARSGIGGVCTGLSLRLVVTTTRAGDPTGLAVTAPRFDTANAYGSNLPTNFNVTSDQTRGDYDTSIEVMGVTQNITRVTQFSFVIPQLDTANVTFYFTQNFKR